MGAPRRIWVYQGFVDLIQREALVAGQRHALSPTEVALLDYLEARAGQTVGRAELLKQVWGYHERVVSRTLDTTVARLRVKVEADPANPRHMLTVSGEGYRFRPLGEPLGGRLGQSPLVGRATALEALDRHAALGVPVVTVCGLGGMGKSRLVSAWAEQRGVPMIEVAALSSPEEVRAALAAALGVSDGAGWSRLGEVLGQGRLPAIVLDQVEHLLPALLAPMATLTRRSGAAGGASVVLTSRVPVNAPGERLIELGPLSPEEALTLYELRRSGARDPDAPELLARVGHIPLAVELVAARSRSMSARDQIRTLGLGLLEDPSDPGRSVRRSIAGAWSTLEARERRGLRALVVFRGAFTVEAAIAVLGDEPQRALTVLHHLRERALVSPAPGAEGRSNVLEPIRWFVAEALPHDGGATLRHAAWFGRWVSDDLRARLDTDEGAPRAAIAAEAPELLAALSSALELGRPDLAAGAWLGVFEVTRLDGRFAGEVARLGERVLGADGLDEHTLIAVASRLGDVQRRRGRTAEARALTAEATERAEVLGDARLLAFCAHAQGIAIYDDGDLGAAEALAQRAQALARTAGAPEIEAGAHVLLANICLQRGEHDANRRHLLAACDWYRASGNRRAEGIVLGNLGNHWHDLGELAAAEMTWLAALERSRSVGDRRHEGSVLANVALLYLARGELEQAETTVRAAIQIHHAAQTRRFEAIGLVVLADVLRRRGQPMEALLTIRDALRIGAETSWPILTHVSEASAAEIELDLGVRDGGLERVEAAERALLAEDHVVEAQVAACRRGRMALKLGDRAAAESTRAAVSQAGSPNGEVTLALDELDARLAEARLRAPF